MFAYLVSGAGRASFSQFYPSTIIDWPRPNCQMCGMRPMELYLCFPIVSYAFSSNCLLCDSLRSRSWVLSALFHKAHDKPCQMYLGLILYRASCVGHLLLVKYQQY
jgi:hypothetical protein